MSVNVSIQLICDVCGKEFKHAIPEDPFKITAYHLRTLSCEQGWITVKNLDYCPEHVKDAPKRQGTPYVRL